MSALSEPQYTIVLPVMNEVRSLDETITIIDAENRDESLEYVIVLSPKAEPEARDNAFRWAGGDQRIRAIVQERPRLGGALIDAFEQARGRWIVMMASDLETDPHAVVRLIERSKAAPDTIVATTRWRGEGAGFDGYRGTKQVANKLFQWGVGALYRTHLTDLTYGFRLYPSAALRAQRWTLVDHGFLLESLLRPMKQGWEAVEIPVTWTSRQEGVSSNSWRFYASYFKIAALIRFGDS